MAIPTLSSSFAEGQKVGRLTLKRLVLGRRGACRWECVCECGNERTVAAFLLGKATTSCGLCRKEVLAGDVAKPRRDPRTRSEYGAWTSMRDRCNNPRNVSYSDYGCRGIKVCPEWDSFEQFYADMGPKPSLYHTIERLDNDSGYSKANCAWRTRTEQARNNRHNHFLEFGGRRQTIAEWAEETGITYTALHYRVAHGWGIEKALTTPAASFHWRDTHITWDGRTQTVAEWAQEIGIAERTLRGRLDWYHWPLEKAMTQPNHRKRK